jgi:hypothetical protein
LGFGLWYKFLLEGTGLVCSRSFVPSFRGAFDLSSVGFCLILYGVVEYCTVIFSRIVVLLMTMHSFRRPAFVDFVSLLWMRIVQSFQHIELHTKCICCL